MARYFIQDYTLSNIANAIRERGNLNDFSKMTAAQMPSYIQNYLVGSSVFNGMLDRTISVVSNSECTVLGSYALAGCTNLATVNLPNLTTVSTSAFYLCTPSYVTLGLSSISTNAVGTSPEVAILAGNDSLKTLNLPNCTALYSSVCQDAPNLTEVSLPLVDILTQSAFYGCTSLTEVSLPVCGTTTAYGIGTKAFAKCTSLSKVYAPCIISMNANAFSGCTSLKEFYAPKLVGTSTTPFNGVTTLESVTIGYATIPAWSAIWPNLEYFSDSAATAITSNAFYGCTLLSEDGFYAPGLTTLTQNAFRNTGFINVNHTTFPNVTALASAYIFYQCVSLESVNMSKVTGTLGNRVFSGCTNLTYVSLPGVTSVYVTSNYLPLLNCPNLVSANFNGLTVIPNYLFSEKTALKTVYINAATTLNSSCFKGCTALSTLTLPAATKISAQAFSGCTAFGTLKIGTSNCALQNSNAFTSTLITATTGSILVPSAYVDTYKAATNWITFADRIFGY